MNPVIVQNIIRAFAIFLLQTVVLNRVDLTIGSFSFIHILIYPYLIILLPIRTPRPLMMIIGFIFGLCLDMFYNSPGVHAAALVFTAYIRAYILKFLEPYEGYNATDSPTLYTLGLGWFMGYSSIILILHLFFYFSIEAFSFVYFFDIVLNTIFSFIPSIVLIIVFQLLFKSKY